MFKMFRSPLSMADPATVVTVFTSTVIKHCNMEMLKAAEREGKPHLFKQINPTVYHNILENILTIIFGRVLVRMTASDPEASALGIPIPRSPALLPNSPAFRKMIELTLSWAKDKEGYTYIIEGMEEPSVWRNAFFVGLTYANGGGADLESRFRIELGRLLSNAGYTQASITRFCDIYTSRLDNTVDLTCKNAEDTWLEVPISQRDIAKEHFASTNASVATELNRTRSYSVLFERVG